MAPTTHSLRPTLAGVLMMALLGGVGLALAMSASSPVIAISAVGRTPSAIVVDPRSGHVFVANSADNTVTMLDAHTGRVLRTISVGGDPDQLRVNPRTERVFVMNEDKSSVSVVDAVTGAVLHTLTPDPGPVRMGKGKTSALFVFDSENAGSPGASNLPGVGAVRRLTVVLDSPAGTRLQRLDAPPHEWGGLAVDSPSGRLIVSDPAENGISLIDAARGQSLRTIAVGAVPAAIALDLQTRRVFVTSNDNTFLLGETGRVSVLDSRSGRVLRRIAVGGNPDLLAVDAPAGRVLVVHAWGGLGSAGSGARHGIDVLDARDGRLLGTLGVGAMTSPALWLAAHPQLVAVDERRGHTFVLARSATVAPADALTAGSVSIVDDRSVQLLRTLPVGLFPVAVAVDARGGRLFVVHTYADCHDLSSAWAAVPASVRRWLPSLAWLPQPPQGAQLVCAGHGSVTVLDLARL
jgi:YVTN family beta-propeller protein